ncbi:MAG: SLC13 family permease [Blastocatellia bacterium]|nr:SLC13 family permease [Blastocatellia bacterium]
MTSAILTVLILLCVAVFLFALERIPIDIVTMMLLVTLVLTRILTPQEAFAGFGNDVVITICGLFVLTAGLVKTGVVDTVGRWAHSVAGSDPFRLTLIVMVLAGLSAAVMKNTTTTAMFLPMVIGLAERARIPPSKLLMPLAFGAILGGTSTLIGTSTNLVVGDALERYGMPTYTMFELTRVGAVLMVVGITYMLTIGVRLLPKHAVPDSLTEQYQIREYFTEVLVLPKSKLVGKTLDEVYQRKMLNLHVVGVLRNNQRVTGYAEYHIQEGDLLLVEGKIDDILRVKAEIGIEILPDFKLSDADLETETIELFEIIVLNHIEIIGSTLKELNFHERFQVTVLAIDRQGETRVSKLSSTRLRFGDVLLVQGKRQNIERLVSKGSVLLKEVTDRRGRPGKRRWALTALALFLGFSVTHTLALPVAALVSVLILLGSRAILVRELYDLIDWRLIVLIAGMMSFGTAMEKTGTDKYLAQLIVQLVGGYGELAVLAGFFVLTAALTQPMSNQAAALVVLPIAIKTAVTLGVNPRTFAVMVTLAASCSFITPLEPACVLIYTPGHYRFFDFVKVGTLLTIMVFIVVMMMVPLLWPLH